MEYHKGIMRITLAESLRILMQKKMFEKITIKNICDEAGVIRATFYKYFDDKYDCLNWLVYHDLVENAKESAQSKDLEAAIVEALKIVEENKSFYRSAFQVIGQNSFEEMVKENFTKMILQYLDDHRRSQYLMQYSNTLLSKYYGDTLTFILRVFVFDVDGERSVHEIKRMLLDLMKNSFNDFVQNDSVK